MPTPNPPIRLPNKAYTAVALPADQLKAQGLTDEQIAASKLEVNSSQIESAIAAFAQADEESIRTALLVDPAAEPITFDESKVEKIESLSEDRRKKLEETLAAFEQIGPAIVPESMRKTPGLAAAITATTSPDLVENSDQIINNPEEKSSTGLEPEVKSCPRCNWDLHRADLLDVSIEDKRAFLVSLYGARFKKAYLLTGGQIRIVFRSLTQTESTLISDQTTFDAQQKPGADYAYFLAQNFKYRLACSLESLEFADGKKLVVPVDQFMKVRTSLDPKSPVKASLPGLLEYISEEILKAESLSRIVSRQFTLFQRLVEWMEENIDNEDFFEGIRGSL